MTENDFNKPSLAYPKEIGSIAFSNSNIPIEKSALYKLSIEAARDEFDRLKTIAELINAQARNIQEQLEISAMVNQAEYNFKPSPNETYWLVNDKEKEKLFLCLLGPEDWAVKPPDNYKYIQKLKYLANGLWQRING